MSRKNLQDLDFLEIKVEYIYLEYLNGFNSSVQSKFVSTFLGAILRVKFVREDGLKESFALLQ